MLTFTDKLNSALDAAVSPMLLTELTRYSDQEIPERVTIPIVKISKEQYAAIRADSGRTYSFEIDKEDLDDPEVVLDVDKGYAFLTYAEAPLAYIAGSKPGILAALNAVAPASGGGYLISVKPTGTNEYQPNVLAAYRAGYVGLEEFKVDQNNLFAQKAFINGKYDRTNFLGYGRSMPGVEKADPKTAELAKLKIGEDILHVFSKVLSSSFTSNAVLIKADKLTPLVLSTLTYQAMAGRTYAGGGRWTEPALVWLKHVIGVDVVGTDYYVLVSSDAPAKGYITGKRAREIAIEAFPALHHYSVTATNEISEMLAKIVGTVSLPVTRAMLNGADLSIEKIEQMSAHHISAPRGSIIDRSKSFASDLGDIIDTIHDAMQSGTAITATPTYDLMLLQLPTNAAPEVIYYAVTSRRERWPELEKKLTKNIKGGAKYGGRFRQYIKNYLNEYGIPESDPFAKTVALLDADTP